MKAGQPGCSKVRECEKLRQRWVGWAMMMYKHNEEEGKKGTKEFGRPKVWIERTAFPGLDGNQEK